MLGRCASWLLLVAVTATAQPPRHKSSSTPMLPQEFAGWQKKSSTISTEAAKIDPTNAAVLSEYGFAGSESATYARAGRRLEIKAIRFSAPSGALGAFTFYRQPEMLPEEFGDVAASHGDHILFVRGNSLVEAVFERISAMSAAELRTLASALPAVERSTSLTSLRALLDYLPRPSQRQSSRKYILGPAGYAGLQSPVPAALLDFASTPEIAAAGYSTANGEGRLLVIEYPTPQIALLRARAIRDFLQNPAFVPAPRPPIKSTDMLRPITVNPGSDVQVTLKRSGPLLVLAYGAISPSEAESLEAAVNYDAQVTWDEPTNLRPQDNIGSLIVGIFLLIGLLIAVFLLLVIFFGGLAVILKRLFPNRTFRRRDDLEIIKLNLHE